MVGISIFIALRLLVLQTPSLTTTSTESTYCYAACSYRKNVIPAVLCSKPMIAAGIACTLTFLIQASGPSTVWQGVPGLSRLEQCLRTETHSAWLSLRMQSSPVLLHGDVLPWYLFSSSCTSCTSLQIITPSTVLQSVQQQPC